MAVFLSAETSQYLLKGVDIVGSRAPSRQNPASGAITSTFPGPREGSSILNVDLVVAAAAVSHIDFQLAGGMRQLQP